MRKLLLKYGQTHFETILPKKNIIQVIEGEEYPQIADIPNEVKRALDNPIDSLPLKQLVKRGETVAIVVSDITRAWLKYPQFLPDIIKYLNDKGVKDNDIVIVMALGAHRKHTPEELETLLTKNLVDRIRVIDHDCHDKDQLKYMGDTSFGTKVYLNKHIVGVDKVILTGGVVYHFMAGYGGGRKSILPGISGYTTIQENHLLLLNPQGSLQCLNTIDCASGKTKGNPMHEDQMEIAAMLNPDFIFNVVMNPQGQFAGFYAGNYITAWEKACQLVDQIYGIPIEKQADLVIATCGGFPKDLNLYQTSKTMDNASQAVKPGGVIILLSECKDIKEPHDFAQWFDLPDINAMEKELRRKFTIPGYAAVYEVQQALATTYIMVTLAENSDLVKKVGMIPVTSLEEAIEIAYKKCPLNPSIIVMPQGSTTLPRFNNGGASE